MTSAEDFHLISWSNFFMLAAVVVGVMIPVGIRWWFGRKGVVVPVGEEEEDAESVNEEDEDAGEEDRILTRGPPAPRMPKPLTPNSGTRAYVIEDEYSGDEEESDDDEDVILESGPAIIPMSSSAALKAKFFGSAAAEGSGSRERLG